MKPWEETWYLDVETFDGPRDNPGPGRPLICERYDHKHGFGSRVLGYIDGPPDWGRTKLACAAPELYRALDTLRHLVRDVRGPWTGPRDWNAETDAAIAASDAALKKARGE